MFLMSKEERQQAQKQAMFVYTCKFLTIIIASVALWQGFVAVAFFILLIALLG